jgi:hypothetical protein
MNRSKKRALPQLPPALPSEEVKKEGVLSVKWGGRKQVRKAYCLFYYERPKNLYAFLPCYGYVDAVSGNRLVPPCPDFERCGENPAGSGSKKKPYDCLTVPDPSSKKK